MVEPNSVVRSSWRRPEGWSVSARGLERLRWPGRKALSSRRYCCSVGGSHGIDSKSGAFGCHRRSVDSARRQVDPDPGAVVSWSTSLVLGAMTGLLPTAILTL